MIFFKATKRICNFLTFLLNMGTKQDEPNLELYIRMTNFNGLIYFAFNLLLALILHVIFYDLHQSMEFFISAIAILICSIGFNFLMWTNLSRLSTVSIGSALITYCAFCMGPTLSVAALLLSAATPFVYFSVNEKKSVAFCLSVPLVLHAVLISAAYKLGPDINMQDSDIQFWIHLNFFFILLLGIVISIYSIVMVHEKKIKSSRESLDLLETIFLTLTHDLANPLQSIYIISHLTDEKGGLSSSNVKKISDNAKNMSRIYTNLRNVARASSNGKFTLQLNAYPVSELIKESVAAVQDLINAKKINLEFETANVEHLCILVDRDIFVFQVLANFLTNSIKFSDPGKKIKISICQTNRNNSVKLVIRDWGRGIERSKVSKLFSWQERTSNPGTFGEIGMGIGLPLAYKFLKSMNGDLNLISQHISESGAESCGTQVTISLPRCQSQEIEEIAS